MMKITVEYKQKDYLFKLLTSNSHCYQNSVLLPKQWISKQHTHSSSQHCYRALSSRSTIRNNPLLVVSHCRPLETFVFYGGTDTKRALEKCKTKDAAINTCIRDSRLEKLLKLSNQKRHPRDFAFEFLSLFTSLLILNFNFDTSC